MFGFWASALLNAEGKSHDIESPRRSTKGETKDLKNMLGSDPILGPNVWPIPGSYEWLGDLGYRRSSLLYSGDPKTTYHCPRPKPTWEFPKIRNPNTDPKY